MNVVTIKKTKIMNDKSIFLYKIISIVALKENKRERIRYYYSSL